MRIAIRVDSGIEIGIGHVMRCLSLATYMRHTGHEVLFICKMHEGNLIPKISEYGFDVAVLPIEEAASRRLSHSSWLGGEQYSDAHQTICSIHEQLGSDIDLVIVDHYGVDHEWEALVNKVSKKLMVIDDLADRVHDCDYLLDQTFLREKEDYEIFSHDKCTFMLGTNYALLRDEFSVSSEHIIQQRESDIERGISSILIMMGGTDPKDLTSKVLDALLIDEFCWKITIVLGKTAPHFENVSKYCNSDSRLTLLTDVSNVAELMLSHQLCIGAPGSTSWERCALGLPSIVIPFADNQLLLAQNTSSQGLSTLCDIESISDSLNSKVRDLCDPDLYMDMVHRCLKACDGMGTSRVYSIIRTPNAN